MRGLPSLLGVTATAALALFGVSAAHAQADNYPTKPVTIISDAAPGATPDVDARFSGSR